MSLRQGDVSIGDVVRFDVDGGSVEGVVKETAADWGVVGIQLAGTWFSAGVHHVTLIRKAATQ
ncbi:hypothetical protein [Leifsonia sp. Leaf264]|uniref:hypothetical protein n=1 Tax=Leifsonia sp. Leaf264 TaxID=1736314 RepID=UPI0006F1F4F0|nr:hypothetical protein [Leifsonia sp. Leaf264]KQO98164.1 hypothetical protein ASF30_08880 [Leifsonia sp. Leaf264]